MEQSERYKHHLQQQEHLGFGDFPTPPPQMRQPQPSSRIRFADDTKPSARDDGSGGKIKQVLVLGGDSSGGMSRQQQSPHRNDNIRAPNNSYGHNNTSLSISSTTPAAQNEGSSNTLDFSMIATPGGKRIARVMVNEETASYTSESSSHFATPFTNMLRGVVSSTPGILTSATEAALKSKYANKTQNSNNNNNHDDEEECTALTFAKSAPHSGYLKKLGKNVPSFKRRFFVLKPSTHLYYFMSPNDVEPRGCIDLDNFVEGSEGGCQVNEIGVLPDGTFRFELVFDEEEQDLNDAILDYDDDNVLETKNSSNRQNIVLEARTEEIGREWMSKIRSERLSVAKSKLDGLQTSLEKSEVVCAQWEESALEEKRKAKEAEASRNVAIAEAKSWEGRFRDLNEAIRLLSKETTTLAAEDDVDSSSSLDLLGESLQGLELNGSNFEDVTKSFQRIRTERDEARKKKEYANESIIKLQQRLEEVEKRASKAEAELAQAQEDTRSMQNELKKVKREKKILVKEVKSLHENRRQQEIENNNIKQHQSDQQSNATPSIRSNGDHRRLILELEEHVMSGLRLSEQFLTLNGIDPSEVGDDLDSSIQTSSKASDISPLRRRRIPAVIRAKPEILGDDLDSIQASSKSDMSPLRQMQNKPSVSPQANAFPTKPALQFNREMSNLLDDDEEEEEEEGEPSESDATSHSERGLTSQSDVTQPKARSDSEKSVKQNLNEIFEEEDQQKTCTIEHSASQSKQNHKTSDASSSLAEVASFRSSESSRSKVTDNGHATTKLVKAPQDTMSQSSSIATTNDDGGVYHITFYRKRLGLQFQKVPNESGTTTGLLTNVLMTADGLDAPESTATELQRIASMSQHSRNRDGNPEVESILPVSPVDAVIVCGFIGFDDSSGSIRPKVGARLVAFDGIPVEVGRWTFESIRKAIQARSRPLTLSFRNDTLSPKQQGILRKALDDIAAVAPPPQPPANPQYMLSNRSSRGESRQQYFDDQSLTAASTVSSTSSSQRLQFKKHYSFSETGSSISGAVAPLVSNLMKKSSKQQQQQRKQQQISEPEYLRRQLSSHDQMRLDEFRSSML